MKNSADSSKSISDLFHSTLILHRDAADVRSSSSEGCRTTLQMGEKCWTWGKRLLGGGNVELWMPVGQGRAGVGHGILG